MSEFKYFTKIDIVKQWRAWRATVRVQRQGPRVMMTELQARLALVCASTDDGRLLTNGTNLIWTVVYWVTYGSRPCINGTQKRQNFSS